MVVDKRGGGGVWWNGESGEWGRWGYWGGAGGNRRGRFEGENGERGKRVEEGEGGGDGDGKIIPTPSLLSLFLTVVHIYPEQTPTLTLLYNRIKYHMQATI